MMDAAKAGLRFLIITAFLYTAAVWALSSDSFQCRDPGWGSELGRLLNHRNKRAASSNLGQNIL